MSQQTVTGPIVGLDAAGNVLDSSGNPIPDDPAAAMQMALTTATLTQTYVTSGDLANAKIVIASCVMLIDQCISALAYMESEITGFKAQIATLQKALSATEPSP